MVKITIAAERLGVSLTTMRRLVATGEIGFYRIGKSQMFDEADIQAYLTRVHVAPRPRALMTQKRELKPVKRGPGRPPNSSKLTAYVPGMKVV